MHTSAKLNAQRFFDNYAPFFPDGTVVVDLGSQDVNGSLREVCPTRFRYTGIDFQAGKNVDVVMTDPYRVPLNDNSVDILISSSTFEHSQMFWLLFLDVLRVLKPNGLFYLNVPSNGAFHRHPWDCWRFYPDSAMALVEWAKRNNLNPAAIESWWSATSYDGHWNDHVSVFLKDVQYLSRYPSTMVYTKDQSGQLQFKIETGGLANGIFHEFGPNTIIDMRDLPNGTNIDGTTTLKEDATQYGKLATKYDKLK